jgi:hypothetical protein
MLLRSPMNSARASRRYAGAAADVAADVICQYTNVEAGRPGRPLPPEAKLLAAQKTPHGRDHDYH